MGIAASTSLATVAVAAAQPSDISPKGIGADKEAEHRREEAEQPYAAIKPGSLPFKDLLSAASRLLRQGEFPARNVLRSGAVQGALSG